MSNELEDRSKPILINLIASRPLSMTTDDQRVLAAWATKIVMVSEYIGPEAPIIKQADRIHLKQSFTPQLAGMSMSVATMEPCFVSSQSSNRLAP
jgi:hypothetical protein